MEILLEIREEMSREADYDIDVFAQMIKTGNMRGEKKVYDLSEEKNDRRAARTKRGNSKKTTLN